MKYNKIVVLFAFVCIIVFQSSYYLYAQQAPTYSFIKFDANYKSLMSQAEKKGYRVEEKDINSTYGQTLLSLTKVMNFYSENIYLFFNENKELIYFSVDFKLKDNQPRRILEELHSSIRRKLIEKYGENDTTNFPFYKIVGDQYEIFLHPFQAYSNNVEVSFKFLDRYNNYQSYYVQQIKKFETEDINQTVNNF
ncbi:MAG: hypothetical protein DRP84_02880 [Spirochaetes bacterium]|nr:MAG: hypothetical protein DRP84_02880 [Spirochaetota bacterium]